MTSRVNENRYSAALSPLRIGRMQMVKNRVYFAPMGIDLADKDGSLSESMMHFYEGMILGGCGMLVLGNSSIDSSTRLQSRGLCLHTAHHANRLAPVIAYGADHHCRVAVQLQHYGAQGKCLPTGAPLLSPSGVPCRRMQKIDPTYRVRTMDLADIAAVRAQFVRAACLARQSGADLVQLQASNGYLLSSFLSPHTNRRKDGYGGTPMRRARLLLEVIDDIRSATGNSLEISVRLGIDDCLGDTGQRPHLLHDVARALEQAGVVAIMCSISIGETFDRMMRPTPETRQLLLSGVRSIRSTVSIPIGFAGFVGSLSEIEALVADGTADLVGMTRALFADNDLILKSVAGQAHLINACRFDGNCFRDKSNPNLDRVYCCVNPNYRRPTHIKYSLDDDHDV
ncbi:NADH:flavin oxidoreductase [Burkholderia pyrrocinia]|uniref:NADH:flavin oxidoreductase n=1 Tax=Burkholderia pyrrocinia TaxID=60550 RepID=UPI0030D30CEB